MKTQDFSQSGEEPLRVLTVHAAQLLGHYAPQPPAVGRGLGMGAALLLLRAVLGACPLPVSGGGSCALLGPKW